MAKNIVSRLPPLNSLRAFEAAARHMSIKRAAEELHVTPAAVTHQVKSLEDAVRIKMFHRHNRALELTAAGEELYPVLHDAFASITLALRNTMSKNVGQLRLNTLPSFAQKWLAPRFIGFRELHPEINLQVTTSMSFVDFASEHVDAAIRIGKGNWPKLHATLLIEDDLFPVCAPHLLEEPPGKNNPEIVANYPMLTTIRRPDDWHLWLKEAGVSWINHQNQITHDNSALAQELAAHGMGFAITRGVFAQADIEAGRLVEPFPNRVKSGMGHYFVVPEAFANRPEIKALRSWLLSEMQRFRVATGRAEQVQSEGVSQRAHSS